MRTIPSIIAVKQRDVCMRARVAPTGKCRPCRGTTLCVEWKLRQLLLPSLVCPMAKGSVQPSTALEQVCTQNAWLRQRVLQNKSVNLWWCCLSATFRFLGVFAPKRGSKMYIFGSLGERGKVLVSTFVWLSGFLWLLGLTVVGTVGKLAFSKLYNYQDIYSSYEIRSFSIQKIITITYVLIQMQYEK